MRWTTRGVIVSQSDPPARHADKSMHTRSLDFMLMWAAHVTPTEGCTDYKATRRCQVVACICLELYHISHQPSNRGDVESGTLDRSIRRRAPACIQVADNLKVNHIMHGKSMESPELVHKCSGTPVGARARLSSPRSTSSALKG